MDNRKIRAIVESRGLSMNEVALMPSAQREVLGIPLIVPDVDYTPVQRLVENTYLGRIGALRKLFGLDKPTSYIPTPSIDPDGASLSRNWSWYSSETDYLRNRRRLYEVVDEIENMSSIVAAALEIYAEEATPTDDQTGLTVWVEVEGDPSLQAELMALLRRINIEENVLAICRNLAKYGDDFEQVIEDEGKGIVALRYVHVDRLTRIDDDQGRLRGYLPGLVDLHDRKEIERQKANMLNPWQVLDFRMTPSDRSVPHGQSLLLPALRVARQLKILEDSLVVYRINRATDKDVYYIDTGEETPAQQWSTVHRWRRELRKRFIYDQATKTARQEYNPRTPDEDLYIPLPKGSGTRVERLAGAAAQGDVYDVEHFRRSLLGSLRVPAGFIGFEVDTSTRATLSSQDIRFARSVIKIQRAFRRGIDLLCRKHIASKYGDATKAKAAKIKVRMAPVNYLVERMKTEIFAMRADVTTKLLALSAGGAPDPTTGAPTPGPIPNAQEWSAWVLRRFMGLSDDEVALFLGSPTSGLSKATQTIRNFADDVSSELSADKVQLLREALRACRDQAETVSYAEPDETTIAANRNGPSLEDVIMADVEERRIDSMSKRAKAAEIVANGSETCPKCGDGTLRYRIDKSTNEAYAYCANPACQEVGFFD